MDLLDDDKVFGEDPPSSTNAGDEHASQGQGKSRDDLRTGRSSAVPGDMSSSTGSGEVGVLSSVVGPESARPVSMEHTTPVPPPGSPPPDRFVRRKMLRSAKIRGEAPAETPKCEVAKPVQIPIIVVTDTSPEPQEPQENLVESLLKIRRSGISEVTLDDVKKRKELTGESIEWVGHLTGKTISQEDRANVQSASATLPANHFLNIRKLPVLKFNDVVGFDPDAVPLKGTFRPVGDTPGLTSDLPVTRRNTNRKQSLDLSADPETFLDPKNLRSTIHLARDRPRRHSTGPISSLALPPIGLSRSLPSSACNSLTDLSHGLTKQSTISNLTVPNRQPLTGRAISSSKAQFAQSNAISDPALNLHVREDLTEVSWKPTRFESKSQPQSPILSPRGSSTEKHSSPRPGASVKLPPISRPH